MKASLAALHLREPDQEWLEQIPQALQAGGYHVEKSRNTFRCWQDEWVVSRGALTYADGLQIRRLWIGRRRGALSALPQRIYFDDEGQVDQRPEGMILNGTSRPEKPVKTILERQAALLQNLQQTDCITFKVELSNTTADLQNSIAINSNGGSTPADSNLRGFLRQQGFHSVPADFRAAVIAENETCISAAADYANKLTGLLRDRGQPVRVSLCASDKLDTRLTELEQGTPPSSTQAPVIFILNDRNSTVSDHMAGLMQRMDVLRLPWRRAYRSDDRQWSVEDQLGSIVMAAGGLPYFTSCNDEALPWAIGIDISHPQDAKFSTACAALTDPGGNLVHAWTCQHPRNEAMPEQSIRKLVDAAERKIVELDSDPDILIIRDGRFFEHEDARFYTENSIGRVTLVELRKGGNPLLLLNNTEIPQHPAVAFVPDGNNGQHVAFMFTNTEIDYGFAQVLKLHWEERWNGIGLTTDQLPAIVCALSYAPSLGLHRHTLPAPIYWADGIAGASDNDLRFRGQRAFTL